MINESLLVVLATGVEDVLLGGDDSSELCHRGLRQVAAGDLPLVVLIDSRGRQAQERGRVGEDHARCRRGA